MDDDLQWDDPRLQPNSISDVPDAEKEAFYRAFGMAMSAFGGIEASLMHVFKTLMQPEDPQCAFDAFRCGLNFNSQMNMVSALVGTTALGEQLTDEWGSLKSDIKKAQEFRNKTAHMHVWLMCGIDLFGYSPKKDMHDLPIDWEVRKNHQDVVTTEKLLDAWKHFNSTARKIKNFERRVETLLRERRIEKRKQREARALRTKNVVVAVAT
jgi:hypothetical protein